LIISSIFPISNRLVRALDSYHNTALPEPTMERFRVTQTADRKKRQRAIVAKLLLVKTTKFCMRHKRPLILTFKILIVLAVAIGIVRTVGNALDDFKEHQFDLLAVNFGWLGLAALLYLIGLGPAALFWHLTLRCMGQRPTLWESLRAFYISQVGKYVPGKAMVVVIRAGAVRSERCNTTVAASSVFVETLTYMAVGGLMSAAIVVALFHDQMVLVALAIGAMLFAGVPTLPPIFRRVVRLLQVSRVDKEIDSAIDRLNFRLMAAGWALLAVSWCLMGLALWATVKSMPGAVEPTLNQLPLLIACTALSTVLGFISMLPGGIGVRELTIITLMKPDFGTRVAFVSAVLFRLAGLVAEVTISIMLNIVHRLRSTEQDSTPDNKTAP
jgi:uncharacterized membrane protein YbhN (UPF0104 family)